MVGVVAGEGVGTGGLRDVFVMSDVGRRSRRKGREKVL